MASLHELGVDVVIFKPERARPVCVRAATCPGLCIFFIKDEAVGVNRSAPTGVHYVRVQFTYILDEG